ncbi:peptidase M75 superfamily protein [Psychroflexus torquis ATCC 700755]|uniref:Peptidase M75 superfamily protein n=1 Tax=Psychroflexus torquis (strain ATCC 700755 / CIP 106069 / ACAM 623) TaxID=313595 RepID=K4IVN7_PSYTT|nr:imelysin family protein [Psychroflexus torquis]AFU69505.1 peptidase M75 superfamily protein [Psychroflexus torquis ATCC 700755]
MKMKKYIIVTLLTLGALATYSCSDDDTVTPDEGSNPTFDRGVMLTNWADNIIIPSFTDFGTKTSALEVATQTFVDDPTTVNLESLQSSWFNAYISFQEVSLFEIGKAEEINYRIRLNAYPTNVSKIDDYIENGNINFALPSSFDAQGFPALDYLLYGLGETNEETLGFFTTHTNADSYKTLLSSVSQTIHSLTEEVITSWTGPFRDSFVANIASSANGSVDKLTNDFIYYYEKSLRAGKVGIPAGIFSNDPLPQNVEALYKGDISKELLLASIETTQNFFNGEHFDGTTAGIGFKDYLDFLNTIKEGDDLSVLINQQFNIAEEKAKTLNDNFTIQIENDNNKMLETYNELQRNVVFIKVDMLQALSIDVDYVDADGD